MKFSVIIPTYNEGAQIVAILRRLRMVSDAENLEIILIDGGSDDETIDGARSLVDSLVVLPSADRGAQWHAGAKAAHGDFLLFLTPEAQLPGNWQQALEHFWLSVPASGAAATVFSVDYGAGLNYRLAGAIANLAPSWGGWSWDEYGLCTTPELYRRSGGIHPGEGLAELDFSWRLKQLGRIVRLRERIHPAGRRLRRIGPWAATLEAGWRMLRFGLSVPFRPEAGKMESRKPEA